MATRVEKGKKMLGCDPRWGNGVGTSSGEGEVGSLRGNRGCGDFSWTRKKKKTKKPVIKVGTVKGEG